MGNVLSGKGIDQIMEKREYGTTGEKLSIIGFGGIVVAQVEQKEANEFVAEAIDRGINYFDVAPSYMDAEDRLGPALEGKRKKVFLACKTEKRTGEEAEAHLQQSLKKLRTDYFDLYQLHAMTTAEDVKTVFGPKGALQALIKAKEKGMIRYIGFSAHSEEAALALMEGFSFDSVLFPLNWVNIFNGGFGMKIMEKAQEKGVARLALKGMAKTEWQEGVDRKYPKCWYEPIDDPELAGLALRYTLSQSITAAIPPGDIRLFRMALDIAEKYTPITEDEVNILKEKAKEYKPIFPR